MIEKPSDAATPPPPGKKRGCLTTLAVLAVVVGGGYLAYRYAVQRVVASYTEPAPLDLGEPALSPSELGALDGRAAAFAHAVRNKHPVEPLVLSGEELTALVARIPDFRRLGGRARFSIGEGEIQSDLSIPLERLGYPDRWFNGSAAFAVTLADGVLVVTLRSFSVKGESVPEWIVARLRNRNLATELYGQAQTASIVARLESIEVGNGRIKIVPRLRQ
jgi:hypothetical protein